MVEKLLFFLKYCKLALCVKGFVSHNDLEKIENLEKVILIGGLKRCDLCYIGEDL